MVKLIKSKNSIIEIQILVILKSLFVIVLLRARTGSLQCGHPFNLSFPVAGDLATEFLRQL